MFNLYSWQVQCLLPRRKTKMPASQDFSAHTRSSSGQNVIRSHRTGGIKPHLRTFTFEMSAPTMQGKTELWNGRGHTEQRSSYLLPSFAADTSAKSFKRAATALARHIRTLSKKKKEPCFHCVSGTYTLDFHGAAFTLWSPFCYKATLTYTFQVLRSTHPHKNIEQRAKNRRTTTVSPNLVANQVLLLEVTVQGLFSRY